MVDDAQTGVLGVANVAGSASVRLDPVGQAASMNVAHGTVASAWLIPFTGRQKADPADDLVLLLLCSSPVQLLLRIERLAIHVCDDLLLNFVDHLIDCGIVQSAVY